MRTIVVGDVHGCADEVRDLFEKVGLDDADRVIFVGDLIHRGPKDREAVELAMTFGETILGNHEDWALRQRGKPLDQVNPSHRRAYEQLGEEHWKYLSERPLFIPLPEHNAIVVHAGVIPDRPIQCQDRKHLLHLQCTKPPHWKSLWPSECSDGEKFWTHWWKGPERVIFGHSHLTKPLLTEWACGIDTGCVHGRFLTAVLLPGWEIVQVPARAEHFKRGDRVGKKAIRAWPCHGDVEVYSG